MENLFDVINNKMFSVFERKDRRTNYDLLSTIYDIFVSNERQQAIPKEDLIDKITAYIKGRPFEEFDDEDNLSLAEKSAKDKATYKLRQFKKCGWIEEDNANGFEIVVSLSDAAISMLDTFRKIIANNDEPLEYTGYFYIIYNTLKKFDIDKAKALIEQIVKNTNELFNSLQSLHSRIKSFTKQLLNRKELSPQEVLNILLYKYQDQVILTVFNNLKGKDNPSKYTSDILCCLRRLIDEDIDKLVRSYAKTINVKELTSEKFIEIEGKLMRELGEVIARFESVDSFINLIDYKNSKFHTSAIATINFLMNNRRDISGQIDMALRTMSKVDTDEEFGELFEIYHTENLDDQSLHSRKFNKEKKTEIPSEIPHVSEEELEEEFASIFSKDEYSRECINDYVLELLGNMSRVSTTELIVTDMEGFFKLIVLQIFSEYDDMCYTLEYHNQQYFVVGVVLEIQDSKPKVGRSFYHIPNYMLTDDIFFNETDAGRNILNFRALEKRLGRDRVNSLDFPTDSRDNIRKNLYSILELDKKKYYELLPKAIAFKPIPDVSDFVYKFLLPENEVNIESIRATIHTYNELQAKIKDETAKNLTGG